VETIVDEAAGASIVLKNYSSNNTADKQGLYAIDTARLLSSEVNYRNGGWSLSGAQQYGIYYAGGGSSLVLHNNMYSGGTVGDVYIQEASDLDRKSVFIPASQFSAALGSPTFAAVTSVANGWFFDDTISSERICTTWTVPDDYLGGDIEVQLYFTMPADQSSKAVYWECGFRVVANGETLLLGSYITADILAGVTNTGYDLNIVPTSGDITSVTANDLVGIFVGRSGSVGGGLDTADGDAVFLGLEMKYVSRS
jgi:hypothetical protein